VELGKRYTRKWSSDAYVHFVSLLAKSTGKVDSVTMNVGKSKVCDSLRMTKYRPLLESMEFDQNL
jgi:hypothetical protein